MVLKSVDLVETGANPDAEITLYKSRREHKQMSVMNDYLEILAKSFRSIDDDPNLTEQEANDMDVIGAKKTKKSAAKKSANPDKTEEDDETIIDEAAEDLDDETSPVGKSRYAGIIKSQQAHIEELQRRFDMQDMKRIAKSYECIGENADRLAETLYDMKINGGESIYKSYIAQLDKTVRE